MNPDEFRRNAHEVVDWIADYFEGLPKQPVVPDVKPGEIRRMLPETAPQQGESFASLIADLERVVLPGATGWQHPGWFAYFPANSSPPSVLAEMVTAALAQQGMMWTTSPVATELEMVMLDWLVDLLGLPETWKMDGPGGGSIQVSASDASHLALVVARHRQSAPTDQLVAYASAQAHSSLEKGARVAGYLLFRPVDVDSEYAMSPTALAEAVTADRTRGLVPAFVCSTIGTTGTTAVDSIPAISEIARSEGMWHHVDAAFAGNAMICPEFRKYQPGLEAVDSYVFNPHKWLLTNFDCSVFYVADRRPLLDSLQITPPYLRNAQSSSGEVVDYRDWQVPLGRRFRALKLWWVIRTYGAEGLREMIRTHVALAAELAARIEAQPELELVAPVPFSLVSFRHVDGDEATDVIATRINQSGHSYVTPSIIDGRRFIRVSIGGTNTTAAEVDRLWEVVLGPG
ncbi:MAG: pyridoxal phosphate-dependent decarboxylase family protein [Acidimicrobiia bacterium]